MAFKAEREIGYKYDFPQISRLMDAYRSHSLTQEVGMQPMELRPGKMQSHSNGT